MFFKEHITIKNIVFLILVVVALKFISKISLIALLFFAAYVLACSLNPFVDKLEKKMHRGIAATLVIFGALGITFLFFIPVIVVAIKEIKGLTHILPLKIALLQNFIITKEFFGHNVIEMFNLEKIISTSSPIVGSIVNQSLNITMGLASAVVVFLAISMILFYLLSDKKLIQEYFLKLFPDKMKERASVISDSIAQKVGGYIIAQVLTMLGVGTITAIVLMLLNIDYAILLGLLTGILDIIPVIGPTIALVICIIMCYHMGPLTIFLVIVMFLVAQQLANNFIRPVVFGKFLDLHPLIIIFSLLVTAQFLGVWGVILAPALAAMICVLFDELYIKTVNKKK